MLPDAQAKALVDRLVDTLVVGKTNTIEEEVGNVRVESVVDTRHFIIVGDENGDALGHTMADTLPDRQSKTLLETLCYAKAKTLVPSKAKEVERARFKAQVNTLIVVLVEVLVSALA